MSKNIIVISILGPLLLLTSISLLILHSVAPDFAQSQAIVVFVGLLTLVIISRIDYHLYSFSPWPWYTVSVIILVLTVLIGQISKGAVRWITIAGISLQTSEFVKPMLILFISIYLVKYLPNKISSILKYFVLISLPSLLILVQPDLGTTLIIVSLGLTSLIAAGTSLKKVALFILAALVFIPLSFSLLKPYQQQRLNSFIDPSSDPLGAGYNALQSTIAVGSGKFIGRGLGQGTQSHLRFLPERYSDFIFASLVEELGFLGGAITIISYIWLLVGLIYAAKSANSDIGSLICLLTIALILIQSVVNMGMNMGLLPITGITLPLVSAGGSSYISFAALLGVCISITTRPSQKKAIMEIK